MAGGKEDQSEVTEYEKLRLARIAENKARLESLGLTALSSSLCSSNVNLKRKKLASATGRRYSKEDCDYIPTESEDEEEEDDDSDYEEELKGHSLKPHGHNAQNTPSTSKRKVSAETSEYRSDEDSQLMEAIALSLQETPKGEEFEKSHLKSKTKMTKSYKNRVKMTEDELIAHFFEMDDGHGNIRMKELQKVAAAHDFTWTEKDLTDMIFFFDKNGDGKLSVDDFRRIAARCNIIHEAN